MLHNFRTVLVVAVTLAIGELAIGGILAATIITESNHQATFCAIQRRSLPAGHYLAESMRGIHTLLTLTPSTPEQKRQAQEEPPATRRVVSELNRDLRNYLIIEAQQPNTTVC